MTLCSIIEKIRLLSNLHGVRKLYNVSFFSNNAGQFFENVGLLKSGKICSKNHF